MTGSEKAVGMCDTDENAMPLAIGVCIEALLRRALSDLRDNFASDSFPQTLYLQSSLHHVLAVVPPALCSELVIEPATDAARKLSVTSLSPYCRIPRADKVDVQ